ncbi:S8 family serine peptidase [Kitasatospora purpeofusca]|uniref:S8 family serine peptidase n=1 Tax=Kitasatospora purpeofusca TaxID=67352 RepID=UPI003698A82B
MLQRPALDVAVGPVQGDEPFSWHRTPRRPDPEASRLVVVSAGNVREHHITHLRQDDGTLHHLALCDTSPIENPAQAWNVLTVGAYTALTPETIRALLVHEARWTTAMTDGILKANGRRRTGKGNGSKDFARTVLRRYGWGAPNEERVLSSAANAVTMMIQGSLVPFRKEKSGVHLGELKLHHLPWPRLSPGCGSAPPHREGPLGAASAAVRAGGRWGGRRVGSRGGGASGVLPQTWRRRRPVAPKGREGARVGPPATSPGARCDDQ